MIARPRVTALKLPAGSRLKSVRQTCICLAIFIHSRLSFSLFWQYGYVPLHKCIILIHFNVSPTLLTGINSTVGWI